MSLLAAAPPPPHDPSRADPRLTHLLSQWKHSSPLIGARFDPTGRFVFAGAQDNAVVRWSLADGKPTLFQGHRSWVRGLAFSLAHRLLFTADWAGKLLAWRIDDDKPAPVANLVAHQGWVRALAVSPDGRTLASCGNDHLVKLWSLPDLRPIRALSGHDCHVYNVGFHPREGSLVSADLKGRLKVWDPSAGKLLREWSGSTLHKYDSGFGADIGGIRSMAFTPDGTLLACAGITNVSNAFAGVGNPLVVVFDWASGKIKIELKTKSNFQGTAWGVVCHPQGYILGAGGGNGGALWAWKPDNAVEFHTLALPDNARDLDLHPDRRRLAIPCHDGFLRVYDQAAKVGKK